MEEQSEQPNTPLVTEPPRSHGRRWLIAGLAGVGIIVIALLIFTLISRKTTDSDRRSQTAKPLTVGSQPYVYPCDVATREDYANTFALDNSQVGTVSEQSALAFKDTGAGGDLANLVADPTPRFDASCSYSLAKNGAKETNRIDIQVIQTNSAEQAKREFANAYDLASGRYTASQPDVTLAALPSFTTENSYVNPKESSQEIGLLAGSRFVKATYQLIAGDTNAAVTPLLDAYAKTIASRLEAANDSKPLDLTGQATTIGVKFVDVCSRADLSRLSDMFDIDFRPDSAIDTSVYGSLPGSPAAANGVESTCQLSFNTPGDRETFAPLLEKSNSSRLSSRLPANSRWSHKMTLAVNTFASSEEAATAYLNKKTNVQKDTAGVTNQVKDITGIGDKAYKLTRVVDLRQNNDGSSDAITEESLVVMSGRDLIVVSLQQTEQKVEFQTVPVAIKDDQLKAASRLLSETIAENRK